MKIIEYGNNWIIEDQLDNELLNDIKFFLDKNLEFLYDFSDDKENYSTTGDNAKQYWIKKRGKKSFHYKSKEYEDIERRYRKGIHGRLKAASILKTDDIELHQDTAWTVIGEEGSYHTIHRHSEGTMDGVSVVSYLNVPDSKDFSNSIFLVLHADPSSPFVNQGVPSIHHIEPEVGKVLIFPWNIPHGTYPQTKGIRQTFNIDYRIGMKSKSSLNYV